MKIRSLLLAGLLGLVAGVTAGCCCDGPFCEIPKCDPCAPKKGDNGKESKGGRAA